MVAHLVRSRVLLLWLVACWSLLGSSLASVSAQTYVVRLGSGEAEDEIIASTEFPAKFGWRPTLVRYASVTWISGGPTSRDFVARVNIGPAFTGANAEARLPFIYAAPGPGNFTAITAIPVRSVLVPAEGGDSTTPDFRESYRISYNTLGEVRIARAPSSANDGTTSTLATSTLDNTVASNFWYRWADVPGVGGRPFNGRTVVEYMLRSVPYSRLSFTPTLTGGWDVRYYANNDFYIRGAENSEGFDDPPFPPQNFVFWMGRQGFDLISDGSTDSLGSGEEVLVAEYVYEPGLSLDSPTTGGGSIDLEPILEEFDETQLILHSINDKSAGIRTDLGYNALELTRSLAGDMATIIEALNPSGEPGTIEGSTLAELDTEQVGAFANDRGSAFAEAMPSGPSGFDLPAPVSSPTLSFALPLSSFSSLGDRTVTVDFAFFEPYRQPLRLAVLAFVVVVACSRVWAEFRRL